MKKVIIIVIVLIILAVIVFSIVKKQAKKKAEMITFGGLTKAEFTQKLQLAWKDRYFYTMTRDLNDTESWAVEWRRKIDDAIAISGMPLDEAILGAVQYAWASGNPKANNNTWSSGWLREIYVKQELGINPIPTEVLTVVNTI